MFVYLQAADQTYIVLNLAIAMDVILYAVDMIVHAIKCLFMQDVDLMM